jgi:hypothetical protein
VVENDPTRRPRVLATPVGGQAYALGLPGGRAAFLFQGGEYELDVFHSNPRGTGRVRVTASALSR